MRLSKIGAARGWEAALALAAIALVPLGCALVASRPPPPRKTGGQLYAQTCAVCHGAKGEGYAADEAPALADRDFLSAASDDFLRGVIADGRPGTNMSAWSVQHGGPLAPADADAVIAFLRQWGSPRPKSLDERPAAGDAARGAALFAARCARCHGLNGVEGPYNHIGEPQFLRAASNGYLRAAIRRGRRKTPMPGFAAALGDAGVEDVLAFLRGLPSTPVPQAQDDSRPIPLGPVPLNPLGPAPSDFHAYPRMTPVDVVKAQLDRRAKMAILDARAPSSYVAEHIAGAVSVPFYDPSPYLAVLPRDTWLVCYCACPHAESGQLAGKLALAGFSMVTVLDEGFNAWKTRNYGTRSGSSP